MRRLVVRAVAAVAGIGLLAGGLAGPAEAAKPVKPGPVTGLTLTLSAAGDHYQVTADWDAWPNATKYVVKFADASGTAFSPVTVTAPTFSQSSYAAAGTSVTVTVTVYVGKTRGTAAQVSGLLPDVTAPIGAYSVIRDSGNPTDGYVIVQADSLYDDVTPVANLTQTVDWNDGTPVESWSPLNAQIPHTYPGTKAVYYPVVSLTDMAGNTATYQLVVAVADTQAPTGTFVAGPPTGITDWTTITLTQSALSDDLSAPANITRVVNWGDGSAPEAWTAGDTLDHVFSAAGTFTPTVTVTDEAGNSAVIDSTAVTVTADTTPPTLTVTTPSKSQHVRSWRAVRGTDVDTGVGVTTAKLKLVEQRHGVWYAYKGRHWQKIGTKKRAALHKATAKLRTVDGTGQWKSKVRHLRKGVLVVVLKSSDNVGNLAVVKVKQNLTRR